MKQTKENIKYFLLALLLTLAIWLPVRAVFAQSAVQNGLNAVGTQFPQSGLAGANSSTTVTDLLVRIIQIMLGLAGIIAILFVIIGGYYYVTAGGNEEQAEKGKNTVVNAIIGIIVVVLSYIIISVITHLVSNPPGLNT